MAKVITVVAVAALLGVGRQALAEERSLVGQLQGELVQYQWTMPAIQNDSTFCEALVQRLVRKLDRSVSDDEKATLKDSLKTARKCAAKTTQVIREGADLKYRCDGDEALQEGAQRGNGHGAHHRRGVATWRKRWLVRPGPRADCGLVWMETTGTMVAVGDRPA